VWFLGHWITHLFPFSDQIYRIVGSSHTTKEITMPKFNVGDRVKVLDKPNWPDGGYKIGN
jgi:hypothetical protein